MIDVLFDWLGREGWIILNWWLLATIAGITVLPLLWRLLGGLPDRGYTLARPAGILFTGYTFWLLAVLGFIQNTAGNMILAWLIVLTIALLVYFRIDSAFDLRAWWRENSTLVIVTEVLFLVLLVAWAIYRAHQNELTTTEKPMDLAFMSASQRTLQYPPNDPWMAGYSISYYYFGYIIAAMFSTLANVHTTIGYNMHLALLFALGGTTSFGVAYNLVRSRYLIRTTSPSTNVAVSDDDNIKPDITINTPVNEYQRRGQIPAIITSLLAALFVVILGSYQTLLVEVPYFSGDASEAYLEFWDVNQRREPALTQASDPSGWGYWWWFRSARPISDKNLDGGHNEVIAEFPNFSFVLGDSHPHVMAMPFALLAMGLALNLLLMRKKPDAPRILLYGLSAGAFIFLNTWDAPVYLALLVGADGLRRMRRSGKLTTDDWMQMVILGATLLGIALIAYLPFIVGFRSQLRGILPNLINPTQFQQIFLLFGPFLLIMLVYLPVEVWRSNRTKQMNWSLASGTIGGLFIGLLLIGMVFTLLGLVSDEIRNSALGYIDQFGGFGEVFPEAIARRLNPKALLTLIVGFSVLYLVVGRLFPSNTNKSTSDVEEESKETTSHIVPSYPRASGFALMLIGVGFGLMLIPEFFYLRDNFGSRMNTVFKFYYQTWLLFSIACAYGVYTLLADVDEEASPHVVLRGAFSLALIGIVGAGLLFPIFAIRERAWIESGLVHNSTPELSLDGGPRFVSFDDYEAAMCLVDLVEGDDVVIAEADPASNPERVNYNPLHGRIGTLTGLQIILGWPGHESQWRGTAYYEVVGTRSPDMATLYNELRFDVVQTIINRYNIDYIVYGATERINHGSAGESKFLDNLPVVCESGETRIFAVPDNLKQIAAG